MKKVFFIFSVTALLILGACGSGNSGVYISGASINMDTPTFNAMYLKDGEKTSLGTVDKAAATSIFVSDDVYVGGFNLDTDGKIIACYWKGQTQTDLDSDGSDTAIVHDIYADGDDVYLSGVYGSGGHPQACYWKNGVFTSLKEGTDASYAFGITVYDGKLYIAGMVGGSAVYWIDGVKHVLSTNDAAATDIQIVDGVVYVAGMVDGKAVYWEGDDVVELTGGSTLDVATSIQVVDGDIYVAGLIDMDGTEKVVYWKNDAASKVELAIDSGYLGPLFEMAIEFNGYPIIQVDGNDIYVSATLVKDTHDPIFVGALWTNGTLAINTDVAYSSMFVK